MTKEEEAVEEQPKIEVSPRPSNVKPGVKVSQEQMQKVEHTVRPCTPKYGAKVLPEKMEKMEHEVGHGTAKSAVKSLLLNLKEELTPPRPEKFVFDEKEKDGRDKAASQDLKWDMNVMRAQKASSFSSSSSSSSFFSFFFKNAPNGIKRSSQRDS
eukprot:gnl/MRDRNA2_/MRDRNA2_28363_c0_seq1.p1 gnl/MRDRNA2_/MRDRNA2_28363_c0~~gnl/MRDRNA2_/MRDRNA2_28363_c0_seq1.p1  ORF type:complete len:155 (+),score=43.27 gnl/MRDRNA2_/MRDRNA2_28363_c0_seq1:602-1066(+)